MDKIKEFFIELIKTLGAALLIFVFVASLVTLGVHIPLKKLFSVLLPIASLGIIAGGITLLVFFSFYRIKKDLFVGIRNSVIKEYTWELILLTIAFVVLISATFIPTVCMWNEEDLCIWGNEETRTIIIALAALGALYGLIVAMRRLKLNERGFFNDTFNRGAELLGHKELYTRITGVTVLEDLHEHKKTILENKNLIYKTLYNFVRTRSVLRVKSVDEASGKIEHEVREERIDVEIAIETLIKLTPLEKRKELNLAEFELQKLNLQNVPWQEVSLEGANLDQINLEQVNLKGMNAREAYFHSVRLYRAQLQNAQLQKAGFIETNLSEANLSGADLSDANLLKSNLNGTVLSGTILKNVENLTQEQFNKIVYEKGNPPKDLPDGLHIPRGCAIIWEDESSYKFVPDDEE